MDDETIDETTDDATTGDATDDTGTDTTTDETGTDDAGDDGTGDSGDADDAGEEAATTIDLPTDVEGTPINIGDLVIVKGKRNLWGVSLMTTDGGSEHGDTKQGWTVTVESFTPNGVRPERRTYPPESLKVKRLTVEELFLLEFFTEATLEGPTISYADLRDYAEDITLA